MEHSKLNHINQLSTDQDVSLKEAAQIVDRIARLYKNRGQSKEFLRIVEKAGIDIPKPSPFDDVCGFTITGIKANGECMKIGELKNTVEGENKFAVDFTKTEVKLSDQESLKKTSPLFLLEDIILQGKVHWLWGFVFLDDWTSKKAGKVISNPKQQFGNYISKIKKFQKYGFDIKHQRGGDEWWIDYETTRTKIKCNILDARKNYENALTEFEAENVNEAIEKLKSAISPPSYPDLMFANAYILLCRCVFKINYENISESLLNKIRNFLLWYETKLKAAVFFIRKIYLKKEFFTEEDIAEELGKIEAELEKIQKNHEALQKRIVVSEKDKDFRELVDLIQDLREVINEEVVINERPAHVTFETEEFMALKNNKKIRDIFKLNFNDLRELRPYIHDKDGTEDFLLSQIINAGINFDKYNNSASIQKLLNYRLKEEIKQLDL